MFAILLSSSLQIKNLFDELPVLSPFLFCSFVDELLDILTASGLDLSISGLYCGAPMYNDDLALVTSSPEELQAMLYVVVRYANAGSIA